MAARNHTPKTTTVYALIASDEQKLRYVGQTVLGTKHRLRSHIGSAKRGRTPVQKWIASVHARGAEIRIIVLEESAVLHETEKRLIAWYRAHGLRLLNLTEGGEGTVGHRFKGKPKPWLAERNRQNIGKPGRPRYPGETEALMAHVRGVKRPWLSERNRSNSGKAGHPHTEESRAKIRASNTGHTVSAETRAKIGAANRGRAKRPEDIAKWRATLMANKQKRKPVDG